MPDGQAAPEATEVPIIPPSDVKPEDVGTLSLRYVDGVPTVVITGGTAIPQSLAATDGAGNLIATYTATPAIAARSLTVYGILDVSVGVESNVTQ